MERDRGRINALQVAGYEIVEITRKQVWDLRSFEAIAKLAASRIGKSVGIRSWDLPPAQVALRDSLRAWNSRDGRPPRP